MKVPEDILISVRDVVRGVDDDTEDPYGLLKSRLVSSYTQTKWQLAIMLLDMPDLGDQRPSALMEKMMSLLSAGEKPGVLFQNFFVDTGASWSVGPLNLTSSRTGPFWRAHIPAWGARGLQVKLGDRKFSLSFIRVAVQMPILRNDFLRHFWLLVDLAGGCVRVANMEPLAYAVGCVPHVVHGFSSGKQGFTGAVDGQFSSSFFTVLHPSSATARDAARYRDPGPANVCESTQAERGKAAGGSRRISEAGGGWHHQAVHKSLGISSS
jgi:hypothetical protein